MLFNSLQFAIFFLVVVTAYRALPQRVRNHWLLLASLLFYLSWHPPYLLLLLVVVGVNYALLRGIAGSKLRGLFLAASVTFTLGVLAYFKYAAFLAMSFAPFLAAQEGIDPAWTDIFLPLGISFYSFQILALAIDTYRGECEPPRSLARYALFVSFFPQLIAGPILRGSEFLPQLERGGRTSEARTRVGLWLIACGLLKKVVFGDFLLAPFVDEVFANPGETSAAIHLIAVYSFAFQIYFDFSGYTDMARGLASILGFDLPLNFREPYLSRNPSEFWRRWHMTLSRWLRDYLYIPLGGSRKGQATTYRNLIVTMLLGGLWHGAGWLFVIWGGLHGVLLAIHRLLGRARSVDAPLAWRDAASIALTFHAVCLLWIFFRASSLEDAETFLRTLAQGSYTNGWPVLQTLIIAACWVGHVAERWIRGHARDWLTDRAPGVGFATAQGMALGIIVALVVAASGRGVEFIYFQF